MSRFINFFALTIMIIGALNWGLIGLFGFDLVTTLFNGSLFFITRVIFSLVGLAGLYGLTFYSKIGSEERYGNAN